MNTLFAKITGMAGLIGLCALFALAAPAWAGHHDEYRLGDIKIEKPWARSRGAAAKVGGAFMEIENEGAADDRLVEAASPVAGRVELHTHEMDNGVMRMRQVPAIDVPAGGKAHLRPGGFHVMLIGLTQELMEGETFPLTLTFEKAGSITVEVKVMGAGAMGGGHGMMEHDGMKQEDHDHMGHEHEHEQMKMKGQE